MLTDRDEEILISVVDAYTRFAQPMSSQRLMTHMGINLSSATIRQIFSKLDDQGYLEKVHTSSGRVPTNQGYRFLVDGLDIQSNLGIPLTEKVSDSALMYRFHGFFQAVVDGLYNQFPYVPVLVYQPLIAIGIEHIQYIPVHSRVGLLLMHHRSGYMSECYVSFDSDIEPSNRDKLLRWFIRELHQFRDIQSHKISAMFSGDDAVFIQSLWRAISNNDRRNLMAYSRLYASCNRCVQLPDFQSKDSIQALLDAVDCGKYLEQALVSTVANGHVSVFIGPEIGDDRLNACSLVGVPISLDNRCIAAVGLLGPIRMDYRAIIQRLSTPDTLVDLLQL